MNLPNIKGSSRSIIYNYFAENILLEQKTENVKRNKIFEKLVISKINIYW